MISENKGYNCTNCIASFDKASKLVFHQEQCNKIPLPCESPNHKESAAEVSTKNQDFVVEDDFHHEPTTTTSTTNEEQYLGGTSFQMPDNFDLPDEIIQEQLPKARYTSTPIRYAKVGRCFLSASSRFYIFKILLLRDLSNFHNLMLFKLFELLNFQPFRTFRAFFTSKILKSNFYIFVRASKS